MSSGMGYSNNLVVATAKNAYYEDYYFDSYEDKVTSTGNVCDLVFFCNQLNYTTSPDGHTGKNSLLIEGGSTDVLKFNLRDIEKINNQSPYATHDLSENSIRLTANGTLDYFAPFRGETGVSEEFLVSAWFKYKDNPNNTLDQAKIQFVSPDNVVLAELIPTGKRIDGWRKISGIINFANMPTDMSEVTIRVVNSSEKQLLLDDLRFQPKLSSMQGFVYDNATLRLMATLDDNNFATFYEYDDKGQLVRIKRETERGIVTIKEGRQHLRTEN